MRTRLRRLWPVLKLLLTAAILIVIGRQFWRDLQRPELWRRSLDPGWLVFSGVLYLLGLWFSAFYWYRLVGHLGPRPPLYPAVRSYYIGHMGKYLPGKAWALFLRASLVRQWVPLGLATLTSFYEVLTTMSAGVFTAAVLFAVLPAESGARWDFSTLGYLVRLQVPPGGAPGGKVDLILSLLLFVPLGTVIVPPVFNVVLHHLSLPFREKDSELPRIRFVYLVEGLLIISVGWLMLGLSIAATLHGILGAELTWTPEFLARLAAIMGLSYVAGFVIVFAPSGLGVREFFLTLFLTPELVRLCSMDDDQARGSAVLAVLVLRLVWTAAELVLVGLLYALPPRAQARG
jgi:hypothetical protein